MISLEMDEKPVNKKEHRVITRDIHGIPGLKLIGMHASSLATAALSDHYHGVCFEFTYIVGGSVQLTVGGNRHLVSGGDLFVTMPDEVYSSGNTSDFPL